MTQDQHQIYRMIFMMSPGVILFLGKFVFGKKEFYRGMSDMTASKLHNWDWYQWWYHIISASHSYRSDLGHFGAVILGTPYRLIYLALLHLSIDWVGLLKHCFARRCNRHEAKEFGFYPLNSPEEAFSVSEQKINNCRPRNVSEHSKCEHVTHFTKSDFKSSLI